MTADPELAALTITERVILALALEPNSTARDLSADTGHNVGTICSILKPLEIAGAAKFVMANGKKNVDGHATKRVRCWTLTDAESILDRYFLTFYFDRMSA